MQLTLRSTHLIYLLGGCKVCRHCKSCRSDAFSVVFAVEDRSIASAVIELASVNQRVQSSTSTVAALTNPRRTRSILPHTIRSRSTRPTFAARPDAAILEGVWLAGWRSRSRSRVEQFPGGGGGEEQCSAGEANQGLKFSFNHHHNACRFPIPGCGEVAQLAMRHSGLRKLGTFFSSRSLFAL
ncbi:hypothetical protein GGI42DRAFT_98067 [Trichoderma sp. SZMC 28013]